MLREIRKVICGVCAAALLAAASVTASAEDYTYELDGDLCDEIKSDSQTVSGAEGTFETEFGDSTQDKYLSLRFKLFNEYLDTEFWNNDDIKVSVDIKLETEGKDVIGCLPGFNTKWGWVNPSDYVTLEYGEWVTVTETASHYYEEFAKSGPAYILCQVRTNWGAPEQGTVKLSVRNFRITSGAGDVTASGDAQTEPDEKITQEPADGTVNAAPTGEAITPADTSGGTSSIVTQAMEQSSAGSNYNDYYKAYEVEYQHESPVMIILIIVGVAAVIVVGAVIGYVIYRKKKYY